MLLLNKFILKKYYSYNKHDLITIGEKALFKFYYCHVKSVMSVRINTRVKKNFSIDIAIKKIIVYLNLCKDSIRNHLEYISDIIGFYHYRVRYINYSMDLYLDLHSDLYSDLYSDLKTNLNEYLELELYFYQDNLNCIVEGTYKNHNYRYNMDLTKRSLRKCLLSNGIKLP